MIEQQRLNEYNLNNTIKNKVPKKEYLKKFNSLLNGELHEQDWVGEELKQFHATIDSLKQFYCSNCNELWPNIKEQCLTCKKDVKKFSIENDMKPNHDDLPIDIKKLFEELTMVLLNNLSIQIIKN